jgi:hypothetical protein
MATTITRDVIESSLHCRYKGYLKLAGEQGSPSDYEQLMRESRERVRLAATAQLLARHEEGEVLRGLTMTLVALRRGVPLYADNRNSSWCCRAWAWITWCSVARVM